MTLKERIAALTSKERNGVSDPVKMLVELDTKFCEALLVIEQLQEIVNLQTEALKEISADHFDHVMAPVIAENVLEKTKQLMEGK